MDEILTTKEYWNLLGREPILAITWEPDFFQARSSEELTDKDGQTLPISQDPSAPASARGPTRKTIKVVSDQT